MNSEDDSGDSVETGDDNDGNDESGENSTNERRINGTVQTNRADQIACTERVLKTTPEAAIVANLGVASYVLAGVCDRARNFYCWGSMGLTTSIGLGLALATGEGVTVFEGDGSLLMSLGVLSTVAACDPPNLVVVVWDNGTYETTGGQPVSKIDIAGAARACGVRARTADTLSQFEDRYAEAVAHDGATVLVCRVEPIDPDARPPLDFAHVAHRFRAVLADDLDAGDDDR